MKKIFTLFLTVLLILTISSCSKAKDPFPTLFSKLENSSLRESIIELSNQMTLILGQPQTNFDLNEYVLEDSSENPSIAYFSKEFSLFKATYEVLLTFLDGKLVFCSLYCDTSSLSEAEIANIYSLLQNNFSLYDPTSDTYFDLGNDVILSAHISSYSIKLSYGIPKDRL
ncbi:MAG: hypothetical protein HFE64_02630 [Lachnospiraceae bacterium]|jgi:hypothetical protein|nr:hypothetical protein [Lachnospiraceae bacterium]